MPTDIVARLKLQGDQFSSELSRRLKSAESEARSTSAIMQRAFSSVKGIALGAVAGFGVSELVGVGKRALDYASSLGEVSQQLGVTTRDLQVYRYAASQAGIEQDAMDRSLAKLTLTIGKAATGSDKQGAVFRALGIDVRDAAGHVRTAGDVIPQVADALAKVEDPARRAALEVALFGKTGQQLDTLLSGGSAQIRGLAAAADELGIVLSPEMIQRADDAADKMSAVKQVLEAKIAATVADNAEAISSLADALLKAAGAAGAAWQKLLIFNQQAVIANAFQSQADKNGALAGLISTRAGRVARRATILKEREDIEADDRYRLVRFGRDDRILQERYRQNDAAMAQVDAATRAAVRARRLAAKQPPIPITAETGVVDPDLLNRSTKGHKGLTDAQREAREAASKVAAAERELQSALSGLVSQYDPATAAVDRFAKARADLARLDAAGKIDMAGYVRVSQGIDRDERSTAGRAQADAFTATFPDTAARWSDLQADLAARTVQRLKDAGIDTGEAIGAGARSGMMDAAGEVAQLIGVQLRGGLGGVFSLLSADKGQLGAFDQGRRELLEPLKDLVGKTGQTNASFEKIQKTLGGLVQGAQLGGGSADLLGIGDQSKTGRLGAKLGGAMGKAAGEAFAGPLGGLVGSIAGGMLGGALGGALAKTKKASSTLQLSGGVATGGAGVGNSAAYSANASKLGGSVADQLNQIAAALGADLGGTANVSIGQRKKKFVVDTSGLGRTKGAGTLSFADEGEAIRAALADAISDGAITGISQAAQSILRAGGDLQKAITKAAAIESIPKELKARLDPVGAAVDAVNDKFKKLVMYLGEGGASAEQMAQAQQLYKLELDDAKKSAGGAADGLREFLASMKVGADSPFSLRDQEATATAALAPFLTAIDKGEAVDQAKYEEAARSFLDVERALYGSTDKFYQQFDLVQSATNKLIASIDNATPITGATADPFAEAAANAAARTALYTQASADLLTEVSGTLGNVESLLARIAANGGMGGSGFIGDGRNFVAAL